MSDRSALAVGDVSRVLVVGNSSRTADATSALADAFPGPSLLLASTTAGALERLERERADIDCLVCDVRLGVSVSDADSNSNSNSDSDAGADADSLSPSPSPPSSSSADSPSSPTDSFDPLIEAVRTVDPHTPIVALVEREAAQTALEAGATDVVTPGESAAVVVARVQNAIERVRLRERAGAASDVQSSTLSPSESRIRPDATDEETPSQSSATDGSRFRSILDHSSAAVLVLDGNGAVRYASPAVESASGSGYMPDELERTDPLDLVHPDDRESALEDFAALVAAPVGSTRESTYRLKRADGTWRVSRVTFANRLDDPTVEGVVVTVTDAVPVRSSPNPIAELSAPFFALGSDWEVTSANAAARRLFTGVEATADIGTVGADIDTDTPANADTDATTDTDTPTRETDPILGTVVWSLLPDPARETFYDRLHEAVQTASVVEFDVDYPHLEMTFTVHVHPRASDASDSTETTDAPDSTETVDAPDSTETTDVDTTETGVSVYAFEANSTATRTQHDRGRSFEAVVDSLDDGVFVLDGRTIDLANTALSEFAGGEPLVGRDLETVVDASTADRIRERADSSVVRRSEPIRTTLERHGEACPVGISVAPMARPGDDRVVCVVRDETERRRSRAALSSLRETVNGLLRATTRTEICQVVTDAALERTDATVGCVYLAVDDRFEPAAFATSEGVTGDLPVIDRGETVLEGLLDRDEPVVRSSRDLETLLSRLGIRGDHVLLVPLDGAGMLLLTAPSPFSDHDIAFADVLATTATIALARVDHESTVRAQERELVRTNAAFDRLTELTDRKQRIERVLVRAETRAEIETGVCEELAEIDWLAFVWIGNSSTATDDVSTRARAGDDDGYLDAVAIDLETGGRSGEPTGRTVATRSVSHVDHVVHDVQDQDRAQAQTQARTPDRTQDSHRDRESESNLDSERGREWHHEALDRGIQSILSVPLVYDDFVYGALSLYATWPSAFDDPARSIFAELGETIAYAINAVETKQALLTDSVTQLEFTIRDSEDLLSSIARQTAAQLTLETVIPQSAGDDRFTLFVTVNGATREAVRAAATASDAVESVQLITERDDELLFEFVAAESTLAATLADHGAVLRSVDADDDRTRFVAELPQGTDVRAFVDMLEQKYPGTDLLARRERDRGVRTREDFQSALEERLTEQQLRALETAYYSGFFEWPRERTGEEVAHSLGVSQPTFNRHFRTAERKLFTLLFDDS